MPAKIKIHHNAHSPKGRDQHPDTVNNSKSSKLEEFLWFFANRLGLDFNFSLVISLLFQLILSVLIGLRGIASLPVMQVQGDQPLLKALSLLICLALAFTIQFLLIAEAAQLVWLRATEQVARKIFEKSVWTKILRYLTIGLFGFENILLLLVVSGQNNLAAAIAQLGQNQPDGVLTILLLLLNALTIGRSAAVMRTTNLETNSKHLNEHFSGVAQMLLLTASEKVQADTARLWRGLGVKPEQLVPLFGSVVEHLLNRYPQQLPAQMPDSPYGYDWRNHRLVALSPEVHVALSQNREEFSGEELKLPDENQDNPENIFWQMDASAQKELLDIQMQSSGRPQVVDASDPDLPRYLKHRRLRPIEPELQRGADEISPALEGVPSQTLADSVNLTLLECDPPAPHRGLAEEELDLDPELKPPTKV